MQTHHRARALFSGIGALIVLTLGAAAAVALTSNRTNEVRASLDGHKPRNVILFIGDGMGVQEITAARFYKVGAAGRLNVDRMPYTGFDTTWSVKPNGTTPDYVPDSAATGTEWATGKKTIDDRDSMGPSTPGTLGNVADYKTVLEYAQQEGKKVGDVTTADLTDATPAVQTAHISNRNCGGPADMATANPPCTQEKKENGGLGSIAEQQVDHRVDVLLGGGYSRFNQTITGGPGAGKTVIQYAQQDKGINVVTDKAGLDAADASKPVLGLFGQSSPNAPNMSLEWKGTKATLGVGSATETCQENQRPANEPSLTDMTKKALGLLDNPNGFFLQVEGASIDKQDHSANACQQIGETVEFDNAIGAALDYQAQHPDTLIVVTADHSHTSEIVAEDVASGTGLPTGYTNNLTTKDGQTLRMTYGTAGFGGAGNAPVANAPSQQHTGAVVPVWAIGPQGANVLGTNDHTDLFDLLRGAKESQDAPSTTYNIPVPDTTPQLTLSILRKITRAQLAKPGLQIPVSMLHVPSLKLTLKKGTRILAAKTITRSAVVTLKVKKARKGQYKLSYSGSGTQGRTVTITVR